MNKALAAELRSMAQEDQRIRKRLLQEFSVEKGWMECRRVDVANTDRLREIVNRHGWPGRSLVGKKGAGQAWLLAQHASPNFQRQTLRLLAEAVDRGEATQRQLAYLTDRVRMNEGRDQLYGTQFKGASDGTWVPWPIEKPEQLDARRKAVGLEPFAEYAPDATAITHGNTDR